jgi:Family of unknown function (DUF6188)
MTMYGLPDDFDAGAFVGRTLEQVCFTENQVTLHFDCVVDITVESAFVHGDRKSESSHPVIRMPVHESGLMRLLGSSIIESSGNQDGTLMLAFDNGDLVKILDDAPNYESYQIRIGDRVIIV